MAKISIIIPVYNCEQYLERCLESLLNQTFQDIEIILIDDDSTDNSFEIARKYSDSRIKIISQSHQGQGALRNKGLDLACGEYIGFVDADDWVDLNFYEKLYNAAIKNNADIAMADFIRKGPNKHKIRLYLSAEKVYETTEDKINIARALTEGCVWNKIYKKEILKDLRFNEGMYFEDGPFTLKALYNANKLVTVTDTYYYYFQNPQSTVKTMNTNKRNDKIKSRQLMLKFLKDNNIKVKDKSFWTLNKKYYLAGINYLTVMESIKSKKWLLFNVLPVGEK